MNSDEKKWHTVAIIAVLPTPTRDDFFFSFGPRSGMVEGGSVDALSIPAPLAAVLRIQPGDPPRVIDYRDRGCVIPGFGRVDYEAKAIAMAAAHRTA